MALWPEQLAVADECASPGVYAKLYQLLQRHASLLVSKPHFSWRIYQCLFSVRFRLLGERVEGAVRDEGD